MFSVSVVKEHVHRTTWRLSYALSDRATAWRSNVRATDGRVVGAHQSGSKISQPVRVGIGVVIDVGDYFARGGFRAGVSRAA